MQRRYVVALTPDQRELLEAVTQQGQAAARTLTHGRILLKADSGPQGPAWSDAAIAEALEVSRATVERVRQRFSQEGLSAALERRPLKRTRPRSLDGAQEAQLIALACSPAPQGRRQWTLRLLAHQMVELGYSDSLSHETVRRTLKKTH